MRESVRKNRENPAKPAVKIIDMKHAIMYKNEIVKVSLFSGKEAISTWKQRRNYLRMQA